MSRPVDDVENFAQVGADCLRSAIASDLHGYIVGLRSGCFITVLCSNGPFDIRVHPDGGARAVEMDCIVTDVT